MFDAIMEQPLAIVFGGLLLTAILTGGLWQTGKRSLLYAAIAALVLTCCLVVVERMTITPREEIQATVHVIANQLEENDTEAVLEYISAGRPELAREARMKLEQVEIIRVDVKNNLSVELFAEHGMELAEARFNAVTRLRLRRGLSDEMRPIPRFFLVRFKKEEDGRWRIRDYEMHDPRQGIGRS